jgi:aspartyl-tRNA(Asn)/glutamyl-tRNA(Gln) amidotransferase subunit C
MKVTEKDVLYVADLANLELTEQERQRMLKDLNSILEHIDMLGQLDTKDVPPMAEVVTLAAKPAQAGESGTPFEYTMRADEVKPGLTHESAMMNAPDTDGTYFKVPKVIDKGGEVSE